MIEAVPRIGVIRRDVPHPLVAEAEARVIAAELERRIGPITLDLRIAGGAAGPWAPAEHAAWPADVDAVVELDELTLDDGSSRVALTALFARTVAPEAADVRRRMLVHLGLIDGRTFDDASLEALDDLVPTPTDLWLLVSSAPTVATSESAIAALANDADVAARIDAAFDRVAERLRTHPGVSASERHEIERLRARLQAADRQVAELSDALTRERVEMGAVIDELAHQAAGRELSRSGEPDSTGS